MRIVESNEQFLVIDDVFSQEHFQALGRFMQVENYRPVHHQQWEKVWRLTDGTPMEGGVAFSGDTSSFPAIEEAKTYPTKTSIDFVFARLAELASEMAPLVGRYGEAWNVVSAKPFLYPMGTALSWHTDATAYSGAYTFYLHPEWNCQWGGELLIAGPDSYQVPNWDEQVSIVNFDDEGQIASVQKTPIGPTLRNSRENQVLGDVGMGRYIAPKPNRLVVVAGGNHHKVSRIDAAAGGNARWSVSGFFFRPTASA